MSLKADDQGFGRRAFELAMLSLLPLVAVAEPIGVGECIAALDGTSGSSRTKTVVPRSPLRPLIGMGTGPQGQTYWDIGQNLVDLLGSIGGPKLVNVETNGSVQNLQLLNAKFNMTLAIAQADTLEDADSQQRARLRAVANLYPEEHHWVVHADIKGVKDLQGKRVMVSERSEGSARSAERVLKLAGVTPNGGVQRVPPEQALCELLAGKADAVVVVSGQPVGLLRELDRFAKHPSRPLADIHFMPLSVADLQADPATSAMRAYFEPARIEPRSYPWAFADPSSGGVPTVSVRAVLMAFDFYGQSGADSVASCKAISEITRVLQDPARLARLCQVPNHPKWCQLQAGVAVPGWRANQCL